MDVAETKRTLDKLVGSLQNVRTEVGVARTPPRQFAYAKVMLPADAGTYAVVWSPGDRWFNLDSSARFGTFELGEGFDDQTVTHILANYLDAAVEIVLGRAAQGASRILRRPVLTVTTDDGLMKLRRASPAAFEHALSRRSPW